jgi:cytoskeleton protein RodZ
MQRFLITALSTVRVRRPEQRKARCQTVESLGARLRTERERRGFTLERVSASIKISVALLAALERDDLSRWPKGLYRRAFFRSYVTALGLHAEPLVNEFARLFPDPTSSPEPSATMSQAPDAVRSPVSSPQNLRASHSAWRSAALALVEVVALCAAGGLLAWVAGWGLLAASGALALVYYPAVRMVAGRRASAGAISAGVQARSRVTELASVRSRLAALDLRMQPAHMQGLERPKRVAAGIRAITAAAAARTRFWTGRAWELSASGRRHVAMRGGWASARALGLTGSTSGRLFSTVEVAARRFWEVVYAAAEYAALTATRRLNRTKT